MVKFIQVILSQIGMAYQQLILTHMTLGQPKRHRVTQMSSVNIHGQVDPLLLI